MMVSDKKIPAEYLGDIFQNLGKKGLVVSKKMSQNVIKNSTRALDITANTATATGSRNPKTVMSTSTNNFFNKGKELYLGKFE